MSIETKIALIGNSNNNMFALCRHLRDMGYDARLFVPHNESWHFTPSADTYSLDFMSYTQIVPFGNLYWFCDEIESLKESNALNDIRQADIVFACGSAVAYLAYYDIPIDFFMPYGMDLVHYPFFVPSANPNHRKHLDTFSSYQTKGIQNARYIIGTHDMVGIPEYHDAISKLGMLDRSKTFKTFPYIYGKIYRRDVIPAYFGKCDWSEEFFKIKQASELVIFAHARHTWKSHRGKLADKANDKIFIAFKEALDDIRALHPKIITFEYGDDYLATKDLIKELELESYVIWMPAMRRKDIMVGLHYADLAMGQFLIGCVGGGVQTEALVAGTPLVHYVDEQKVDFASIYPFLQCKDENDIAQVLRDYEQNQEDYKRKGYEAMEWVERETSDVLKHICADF